MPLFGPPNIEKLKGKRDEAAAVALKRIGGPKAEQALAEYRARRR